MNHIQIYNVDLYLFLSTLFVMPYVLVLVKG